MRKAYEEYKTTGIQWLPKIPKHWEILKLRQILSSFSEKNHPDMPLLSVVREKGVIIRNIENTDENHNYIPDDLTNYKLVKTGQFAMNKMKAWQGSYGVSDHDGIVSPAYFVFSFALDIDKHFFNTAIRSKSYVSFFGQASDGIRVGQWDLSMVRMKNIPFYVPTREEQKQIVRFLDWKVSSINKLINLKQQEITELKELKKATISNAVTHGLDKTVPMKDSGINWLGKIPQHWNIKRLKYTSLKHFSGTWGNECDGSSNDKNCIRVADFNFENLSLSISNPTKRNYTCDEIRKYALQDGDILVEKSGGGTKTPVGRAIYYNLNGSFLYANFIEMIRVKKQNSKFLVYLLASMYHSGYINTMYNHTTGIQNLDINKYINQQIVLPPREEQEQIVRFLDARCAEIDRLITENQAQITNLHDLKSSLIADVVTGQIDVRDVTIPNYETVQEHADEAPDTVENPLEADKEV